MLLKGFKALVTDVGLYDLQRKRGTKKLIWQAVSWRKLYMILLVLRCLPRRPQNFTFAMDCLLLKRYGLPRSTNSFICELFVCFFFFPSIFLFSCAICWLITVLIVAFFNLSDGCFNLQDWGCKSYMQSACTWVFFLAMCQNCLDIARFFLGALQLLILCLCFSEHVLKKTCFCYRSLAFRAAWLM